MQSIFTFTISLFFISIGSCLSQTPTGKDARLLVRSSGDFEIDGKGSNPAWSEAEWLTLPRIKGTSSYATKAKLLYSETGIYALYQCEDKRINATMQEDFANLWREDVVEIFFWPDETFPIYLEYEISPLNYELVILVPNLNGQANGWTPWNYKGQKKTRKATHIMKDAQGQTVGWTAEFFIPYALMRPLQNVPPKKGTQWRANIYRIDYDEAESTYWSWQPVNMNFHEFQKYGTLVFD